jgi:hypothetical protein
MSTEKPNGKTQLQNPVESSDSLGRIFITTTLLSAAALVQRMRRSNTSSQ